MLSPVLTTSPAPAGEFVRWDDAFSAAELAAIEKYGDGLAHAAGIGWIERIPETVWLYQRLEDMVLRLNAEFFHYELFGLSELFQYTASDGSRDGDFDWRKDHGHAPGEPRKISLSLQLSGENAYQGGDLELHSSGHVQTAPRARGTLIAFPSYVLQRVTPIRAGVRKSLVVWATGPEFQ